MDQRINFNELKRKRDHALAKGVGSGAWIDCARVLMDSFPSLFDTGKAMNEEMATLRMDLELAKLGEYAGQVGINRLSCLLDEFHALLTCVLHEGITHDWKERVAALVGSINGPTYEPKSVKKEHQELTDAEILAIYDECNCGQYATLKTRFARAVIAASK